MYTSYDFSESLEHVGIEESNVARVIAAWGDSPEGYGSWEGGFLMLLENGRYAYLTGWCDTTGWGCQDGADITYFDSAPSLADISEDVDWDIDPSDLNLALHNST